MPDIEQSSVPPPGPPTDLGWMLSCSGVHPEAVKIVEAYQAEVERLREALRDLLDVTERQDAEWDSLAELDERHAIHERARSALDAERELGKRFRRRTNG
jgi:hypothetical protein